MTIHFFNTMSGEKEEFVPLVENQVGMYTCGPTVYNYAHIGNFRTYIFEDLLRRYLKFRGFKVTQVMNLTDVEDKIIRDSTAAGVDIYTFTKPYIEAFFEDLDTLGIERAEHYPKATDHVPEMVAIVEKLQEKSVTYESDGSIYFRISQFPGYGKLSGIKLDNVRVCARIDSDEYEKEDARDFVLWKSNKGESAYWETSLGKGRPGWHIECSAMSMKYLGETFDIHTGGEDNIFPHHENEIAQSECATGKPFAKYWLHSRHLMVGGEKMAKSKGNFYTLRDLLDKGFDPMAIRYVLIKGHYRSPLNFTFDEIQGAASAIQRLKDFQIRLEEVNNTESSGKGKDLLSETEKKFIERMDDDLDIPQALASIFDLVRGGNQLIEKNDLSKPEADAILGFMKKFNDVVGILKVGDRILDEEIENLIAERQECRKNRDFARSDQIRDQLAEQGIILEDTAQGVRWKRS